MLRLLKKAFAKFYTDSVFSMPVSEQEQYLATFPYPQDDIERSYFQYRCQAYLMPHGFPFFLNIVAMPLLVLESIKFYFKHPPLPESEPYTAVQIDNDPPSIIPQSLRQEFEILQVPEFRKYATLNKEDRIYLQKLRQHYPFSFYFRFKCMMKLAMYRGVIQKYSPQCIICPSEYSFTSSFLTDYCHKNSIQHINVMHGEKLYDLHDTFFHFDRCYVWEQHYIDLFKDLRAEPSQFLIEIPPSLKIAHRETTFTRVDYTYYLANEDRLTVKRIVDNLSKLSKNGAKIALRLHPLYLEHAEYLLNNSHGFIVELPREVPIEDSLLRTNCAISLFSTVLLQALSSEIPVMIDDITSPEKYNSLQSLRYIVFNRPHRLFSQELSKSN